MKRQRLPGRRINELPILHQQQNRDIGRTLGQQVQRREGDAERRRVGDRSHAKSPQQGIALRRQQAADLTKNRLQQLVQACKRQPGFRLQPPGPQNPHPPVTSQPRRFAQQRGLTDARIAADHQAATATGYAIDQLGKPAQLS